MFRLKSRSGALLALSALVLTGCATTGGGARSGDLPRFPPQEPRRIEAVESNAELFAAAGLVRARERDETPRVLRVSVDLLLPSGAVVRLAGTFEITAHVADFNRDDRMGEAFASYRVPREEATPRDPFSGSTRFLLELPGEVPDDPMVENGRYVLLVVRFLGDDGIEAVATSNRVRVP